MLKTITTFKYFFLLLFLNLVSSSCEYKLKDEYFRELLMDEDAPELLFVELSIDNDTIYIYSKAKVNFSLNAGNHKINVVSVSYADEEEIVFLDSTGSFTIDLYWEGEYKLNMEVLVSSGTSSIADVSGGENYVYNKEWTIIVIKEFDTELSSEPDSGYFKLNWTKYDKNNLKEYHIYREYSFNSYLIGTSVNNSFVDMGYIGEGGHYYVKVITIDNQEFIWASHRFDRESMNIWISSNQQNETRFHWEKSPYYKAISEYHIFYEKDYKDVLITNTESSSGTILLTDNILKKFGEEIEIRIKLEAANYNPIFEQISEYIYSGMITGRNGFEIEDCIILGGDLNNHEENYIIYIKDISTYKTLVKYSLDSFEIIEEYDYPFNAYRPFRSFSHSPNEKIFAGRIDDNKQVLVFNSEDYSSYTMEDLSFFKYNSPYLRLSNNYIGMICNSFWGNHTTLYDFSADSIIADYPDCIGVSISATGKYMIYKNEDDQKYLAAVASPKYQLISSIPANITWGINFHPDNDELLFLWDREIFYIKSSSDFSTIASFTYNDGYSRIVDIDFVNQQILIQHDDKDYLVEILDLYTGASLYTIPFSNDTFAARLINNRVLSTSGLVYFINQE